MGNILLKIKRVYIIQSKKQIEPLKPQIKRKYTHISWGSGNNLNYAYHM